MFDAKFRHEFTDAITVGEFIEILKTMPQDAQITCDGDRYFYLHVEEDQSYVDIDSSSMETEYADPDESGSTDEMPVVHDIDDSSLYDSNMIHVTLNPKRELFGLGDV